MAVSDDKKLLKDLLGDEVVQTIASELGITEESHEAQAAFISQLGENIMLRIALEAIKEMPEDKRGEFEAHMGSGDLEALKAFVLPLIPDWDKFVRREAEKEYELTKTRIRMMEQGVTSEAE
jgi:hypothetical protein